MKKEDLIKKAAERGITIDETQAEKYINLSDEELENLEVSGGCGGGTELTEEEKNRQCPSGVRRRDFPDYACPRCGEYSRRDGGMRMPRSVCNAMGWDDQK
jgi:hypothetical protein